MLSFVEGLSKVVAKSTKKK